MCRLCLTANGVHDGVLALNRPHRDDCGVVWWDDDDDFERRCGDIELLSDDDDDRGGRIGT